MFYAQHKKNFWSSRFHHIFVIEKLCRFHTTHHLIQPYRDCCLYASFHRLYVRSIVYFLAFSLFFRPLNSIMKFLIFLLYIHYRFRNESVSQNNVDYFVIKICRKDFRSTTQTMILCFHLTSRLHKITKYDCHKLVLHISTINNFVQ